MYEGFAAAITSCSRGEKIKFAPKFHENHAMAES